MDELLTWTYREVTLNIQQERERITNRTIARLLSRHADVHPAVQDDIKRAMWFLSDDINQLFTSANMGK